ncbi:MAG: hypothetical protein NTU53_05880 [Planctomycetota bacterium]|nr:hypothetical protein [Planctomycetota bacterium]
MDPLHAPHEQVGAERQSYGDIVIVSTFGQPQAEYAEIGLGHVKKPFCSLASKVRIPAEGAMRVGTVVALPFIG